MREVSIDEIVEYTGEGDSRTYKLAAGVFLMASEVTIVYPEQRQEVRELVNIQYAGTEKPSFYIVKKRNKFMDNLPG